MANRLIQKRRKCVKSPNIFREKQEYSSLYTISSRSALSIQSAEMISKNANRVFKGHQKGDSAENVRSQTYKYPKLPNDVSLELQQKVYTNAYRSYYNDRTRFIKNKFDSLTLENKQQQYPKPYCPMHISTGRYASQNASKPPQYAITRLEESYWAKWKPNKCDSAETWQNCAEQTRPTTCYPCVRRPRCTTTRMMAQDCLNMLSQAKNRARPKCCDDKPLKIIREPADIRESNSSDVGVVKKKSKSRHSCCTCPSRTSTDSDDEKSSVRIRIKGDLATDRDKEDEPNTEEIMETSQEEYENLYNEMFMEYESDLMNRISEYEMKREQEEMQELERQLAERGDRLQLERASQNDVQQERRESRKSEHENAYSNSRPTSSRQEPVDDERASIHSGDRTASRPKEIDQNRPEDPQRSHEDQNRSTPIQQPSSPRQSKSPTEDQIRSIPVEQPPSPTEDQVRPIPKSADGTSPRLSQISGSPKEQSRASSKEKQRKKARERGGQSPDETDVHRTDKPTSTEEPARTPSEQRNEETQRNRQRQLRKTDQELKPHLSYSNEYSEPEIAILKHTDSFIINSRRQKEDRQKKPQPKFLKLTKTTFSPPPVKGHTYPLKPALKKERQSVQPSIGFSRPISPNTAKMSTPTRQFQPSYLMR